MRRCLSCYISWTRLWIRLHWWNREKTKWEGDWPYGRSKVILCKHSVGGNHPYVIIIVKSGVVSSYNLDSSLHLVSLCHCASSPNCSTVSYAQNALYFPLFAVLKKCDEIYDSTGCITVHPYYMQLLYRYIKYGLSKRFENTYQFCDRDRNKFCFMFVERCLSICVDELLGKIQ